MKRIMIPKEIENNIIKDYKDGYSILALTKLYPYKYDKIYSVIKNSNIDIRGNNINSLRYYCDSNIFDNIDTEEKAYWLGFIYADGCVTHNGNNLMLSIALCTEDNEHLQKFKKFLKSNSPIKTYGTSYNKTKKCCKIVIRDSHLCQTLINHGVVINKSNVLKFPDFINKDLISHFIRGYFDGDGCITYHSQNNRKKYVIKFCLTKEMALGIHKHVPHKSNKEIPTLYKKKNTTSNNYSLEYGGNKQVLNIANYLYYNASVYLDRKFNKYCLLKEMY